MTPVETIELDGGLCARIYHDPDVEQPFAGDDAVRIVVLHRRCIDPSGGECGARRTLSPPGNARTRKAGSRSRCSSTTIPARSIGSGTATRSIAHGIPAGSASSRCGAPTGPMATLPTRSWPNMRSRWPRHIPAGPMASVTATCSRTMQATNGTPARGSSASMPSGRKRRRLRSIAAPTARQVSHDLPTASRTARAH